MHYNIVIGDIVLHISKSTSLYYNTYHIIIILYTGFKEMEFADDFVNFLTYFVFFCLLFISPASFECGQG